MSFFLLKELQSVFFFLKKETSLASFLIAAERFYLVWKENKKNFVKKIRDFCRFGIRENMSCFLQKYA